MGNSDSLSIVLCKYFGHAVHHMLLNINTQLKFVSLVIQEKQL